MKQITLVGIDLAKSVFHVVAVGADGGYVMRKKFTRTGLLAWLGNLSACVVAMEACGGAHFWAQACKRMGHTPKILPPQFVKPFVKSNKSDFLDAEAITEAAQRPNMRFVPVKDNEQLALQALHRVRSQLVAQRTALGNQLRGLLLEFGIELPKGAAGLKRIAVLAEDADCALPMRLRTLLVERLAHWHQLQQQAQQYERQIEQAAGKDDRCRRLMSVPGIGPLTATALVAAAGDVGVFASGRALAAWLGLVPRHVGSGDKVRLLGISKRGDKYLRMLLIHGARAALRVAKDKTDRRSRWAYGLAERKGKNLAAVALANKNARTAWALLRYGTEYCAGERA